MSPAPPLARAPRWAAGLASSLAIVSLAATPARAQRPEIGEAYVVPDSEAAPAAAVDDAAAAPARAPSEPETLSPGRPPAFFMQHWEARQRARRAGDEKAADRELQAILAAKDAAGWPNVFVFSRVLVREASAAADAGHVAAATRAAELAVQLAPDAPLARYARARAAWGAGEYGPALMHFATAVSLCWSEPPSLRWHLGNLLLALTIGLGVTGLGFALIELYRYARAVLHDTRRLLPNGAQRWHAALIATAAVAAPVLFRAGLAWTILIWILSLGLYYRPRERLGAILALGVLVAAPLLIDPLTRYWAYPGSISNTIYRGARDLANAGVDEELRREGSPDARYALGARALWSGQPEQAFEHLSAAVQGGLTDPELFTLLGNVHAQLGRRDKAVEAYQQAVDADPEHVVALFNMSRVLFEMGEYQRGNAAYRRSTAVDLESAERYARQAKSAGRGYVVPARVARRLLDLPVATDPAHTRAVDRVWQNLSGGTPRLHFAAAALVAVILIALMAFIRKPITYPELIDVPMRSPAQGVEARIQTEIASHRYQASIARLASFFAFLVAGGGQLTRGATLSGMFLMLPFVTAVTALLGMAGLLPVPPSTPTGLTTFHASLAGGVAGISYLVALWDGARES